MLLLVAADPVIASSRIAEAPLEWTEASLLERQAFGLLDSDPELARGRYLEAARQFEALTLATPGDGDPYWRASRCRWFAGEILPAEDKAQRLEQFTAAESLAARGIEANPECAECMLWRFIAMGRIATTRGVAQGMRTAAEMGRMLDRGIELQPSHRDGDGNSTLGNLHYSSAIFYRVLPDWFWLGWILGIRGDKERALEHAQTALAMHPGRLDYQVEVGSQLMCLGVSDGHQERLDEGARLLEELLQAQTNSLRDQRQLAAAEVMLESPPKSCGFSGDGWVEIDADDAASVSAPGD
jgi:tetratricopeptide (TPR) repeat protein